MRDAETVLAIIRERGKEGQDLEDVYRQLFNPDLYLRAYGRIYRNAGALTRGVTEETVDGMSLAKIEALIDDIRVRSVNCIFPAARPRGMMCGAPSGSDRRGHANPGLE